jgi:hypothetical protein
MMDYKLSSKYDKYICTLENGEKLFSAEVTLYSSDRRFLEDLHKYYWNKMDLFEPIDKIDGSTALVNLLGFVEHMKIDVKRNISTKFPECEYNFDFTIIYVKEPSNYTIRGLMLGYYNYLVKRMEQTNETWI